MAAGIVQSAAFAAVAGAVLDRPATLEPSARPTGLDAVLRSPLLLVLVVLTGTALRAVHYLAFRSLWLDEARIALYITRWSFGELLEPLTGISGAPVQGAPLLFLWIERAVTLVLGASEGALRLIPFLAGVGVVLLAAPVARRVLVAAAVPLAVLLVAVCEPLVAWSAQVKQYSTDALVAVGLVLLLDGLDRGRLPARRLAWLALAGAVAVLLSHPAVFVLAAAGGVPLVAALRRRDGARAARIAGVALAWVTAFAAVYVVSLGDLSGNERMQGFWTDSFLPFPPRGAADLGWLGERFLGLLEQPLGFPWPLLAAPFLLLGSAVLLRRDRVRLLVLVLPLLFALAASAAQQYPFEGRLLLFSAPLLLVVIAAGGAEAATWLARRSRVLALLALLALLAPPASRSAERITDPRHQDELRPVATWMRERYRPGDTIFVYRRARAAFYYYADRLGFREEDVVEAATRGEWDRYLASVDALRGRERVWLVFTRSLEQDGESERTLTRRHLDRIGRWQDGFEAPGASADLYDLSTR